MAAPYNGNGNGNGHSQSPGRPPKGETGLLTDRLPPQNLEAEQGVLGSVLLDNDVLHDVVPLLKVETSTAIPIRSSTVRSAISMTWARRSTSSPWPTS